jgi:hypothetical protein
LLSGTNWADSEDPDNEKGTTEMSAKQYSRIKQLRERYAGVCEKTIERWRKAGRLPKPDFYRNHIPYWSNETLDKADREAMALGRSQRVA